MEAYSKLNCILGRPNSTFQEFQKALTQLKISQQTYLNLFLTKTSTDKSLSAEYPLYVQLLTNYGAKTGKKSASVNYKGYKDGKSILMHVCQKGNIQSVKYLLSLEELEVGTVDPMGRNALYYAAANPREEQTINIIGALLDRQPSLLSIHSQNNHTLLHECVYQLRLPTLQALLKHGADPNCALLSTGNTPGHQLIPLYPHHQDLVARFIVTLLKYRADFSIRNQEGKSVFEAAREKGLSLEDCVGLQILLQKEESGQEEDYSYEKESQTTVNQLTKMGDNVSQRYEIESNMCSRKADFSCVDLESEEEDPIEEQSLLQSDIGPRIKLQIESDSGLDESEGEYFSDKDECPDFNQLSQQICQLSWKAQTEHHRTWLLLSPVLSALEKAASRYHFVTEIVGSFATGLWPSTSDIDLNLIPNTTDYIDFQIALQRVYRHLRKRRQQLGIAEIWLNKNKVSNIKIELTEQYERRAIELSIFHRNNQNRHYVSFILQALQLHPQIKPLFFVYRQLCQEWDLAVYSNGGLKTYTLFLMLHSVVKSVPSKNIGELFWHVALYFGFYFQYDYQRGQQEQVTMHFNLIDPLNCRNNMGGKNTRVAHMQQMFRTVYYFTAQVKDRPYLSQIFKLRQIFEQY